MLAERAELAPDLGHDVAGGPGRAADAAGGRGPDRRLRRSRAAGAMAPRQLRLRRRRRDPPVRRADLGLGGGRLRAVRDAAAAAGAARLERGPRRPLDLGRRPRAGGRRDRRTRRTCAADHWPARPAGVRAAGRRLVPDSLRRSARPAAAAAAHGDPRPRPLHARQRAGADRRARRRPAGDEGQRRRADGRQAPGGARNAGCR